MNQQTYWNEVSQHSQHLITSSLNKVIPISLTPDSINWNKDQEFQSLINKELPLLYKNDKEQPDSQLLARELTYHYLNSLCSNIQNYLIYEETN